MRRPILLLTPALIACSGWFYQAPPPLQNYPQRIPAKTWPDILRETHPLSPEADTAADVSAACRELSDLLPSLPLAERLTTIDDLIQRNREGEFSANTASLLLEFRELAADDSALSVAKNYLQWRLQRPDRDGAQFTRTPERDWSQSQAQIDEAARHVAQEKAVVQTRMDEWLKTAPPALVPNYLVQHATFLTNSGKLASAAAEFRQVIATYPAHPRAEVAALMLSRTLLRMSRAIHPAWPNFLAQSAEVANLRQLAADGFTTYLKNYPQGRFTSDVHGWLGAIACDEKRYGDAISHQIDRLEIRPSRETISSVLRECDDLFTRLLRDWDSEPDAPRPDAVPAASIPWDAIARHPDIARLLACQMLDPTARETLLCYYNESRDNSVAKMIQHRIVATRPFVQQAFPLLLAAVEKSDHSIAHPPATLLIFGWASLQKNDPDRALSLFNRALKTDVSDDLLAGRATCLSRLRRYHEAAAAYARLAAAYPDSPLLPGLEIESCAALICSGQPAKAIPRLQAWRKTYDQEHPRDGLHYDAIQWIDLACQFCPAGTLSASRTEDADNPPTPASLLRGRAFAVENFSLAKHFLDSSPPPPEPGDLRHLHPPLSARSMDRERWDREVQPLADACERLKRKKGDATAPHLEIARRWVALRGKITMPLGLVTGYATASGYFEDDERMQDLVRRDNAVSAGIMSRTTASAVLDSRDELVHALPHFLAAAKSNDPAIAAPALEAANDSLYQLAGTSLYTLARAAERNDTALSARLVAQLHSRFPKRPETARAVAYNLTSSNWSSAGGSGNCFLATDRIEIAVHQPGKSSSYGSWTWDYPLPLPEGKSLPALWKPSPPGDPRDLPAILVQLRERYAEVSAARTFMHRDEFFAQLNRLDDLILAATQPGMTPVLYRRYESGELAGAPADDPDRKALSPLLAYQAALHGEFAAQPSVWHTFLADFPDSPRTETATLQFLRRRLYRLSPVPMPVWLCVPFAGGGNYACGTVAFPNLPGRRCTQNPADLLARDSNGGRNGPPPPFPPPPPSNEDITQRQLDLAALTHDLRAFHSRYPSSRYLPDLALLDAAVALETGHYQQGLSTLATTLGDTAHPELFMDAALRLAEFGMRLLDPAQRPAVARAFRATPAILPYLNNLAAGNTCLTRLQPLLPWLERSIR
jgi:TolA-binding protein